MLFLKIRISVFVFSDNRFANLIKERTVDAEQLSVARGAAEKTAQNITSSLVGGHYAVAYHKGCASDMVGYNTKRNVAFLVIVILYSGNVGNVLHDIADGVHLKEVINALHDARKPFKTHAGINIAAFKARIISVAVVFKLSENKVPELGVSVAVTARAAIRRAAAVFFTAVKVNFRAGTAGACSVLPEIVLLAKPYDPFGSHPDLLCPDVKGFVVVLKDGDPELVHRHFHNLGAELPCPGGGFMLEIIAERKVSEHFKISSVPCGYADSFNIRRAYALLAGGHSLSGRSKLARKIFFERSHACVDEQQALVALRNKRKAVCPEVSLAFKKREKLFPDVVKTHPFHIIRFLSE